MNMYRAVKIASFYILRPSFLFPLETPLTQYVAWMERQFNAHQTPRSMYPSIFNSFPVIRTASAKNRRFHVPQPTFLFPPGDAPAIMRPYVAWMKRQFNACQTPRSMYPSIFNSFPVIRTASVKNRHFHVLQPTFLFPLETPLRLSRNIFHGWKDNSMLTKCLAACTHLTMIVCEILVELIISDAPC